MKTLLLLAGIWGILLPAACLFHWVRNYFYRRRFSGKAGAVVTSPSPGSVRYTYTVNDTAYFREIGSGFMDRCGTCVDIRYDPSAPSLSRRDRKGWESCVTELLCVLLLPGFTLCPVLCAFSPTEEAPAVVRECREFRNSSKKKRPPAGSPIPIRRGAPNTWAPRCCPRVGISEKRSRSALIPSIPPIPFRSRTIP